MNQSSDQDPDDLIDPPTLRQTPIGVDLLTDTELAERWKSRFEDVFSKQGLVGIAHMQTSQIEELMFRGNPIQSNGFVLHQGLSVASVVNREIEEQLVTTLGSVPFVTVGRFLKKQARPHPGAFTIAWSSFTMPTSLWADSEDAGDGTTTVVQSIVDRAFEAASLERPSLFAATLTENVWRIELMLTRPNHRRQVTGQSELLAEILGARWLGVESTGERLVLHAGIS